MDFGHLVGEVELQKVLRGDNGSIPTEQQKQREMQAMDERIAAFMETYAWAFASGEPKGKLTAYFERARRTSRLAPTTTGPHLLADVYPQILNGEGTSLRRGEGI
ncbi:hypothetical protein Trco_004698 [Trichoderma cornu-damae]|uniref:Uncharacterized protein n=1 Tax=Trichoderma cornu-damae TaxID=654480 RepID=A0A9P8QHS9_9HYPO|nr:hypothetical protein Trco_004698 [Trichoderma cornu-damae]